MLAREMDKRKIANKSILELIVSFAIFILGAYGHTYIFPLIIPSMTGNVWTVRDIPYQKLNSGEILLDMALNETFVPLDQVTFTDHLLWFVSLQLPLIMIFVCPQNLHFRAMKWAEISALICALLVGLGTSEMITNTLKLYVGRLRPNFYQMCGFDLQTLTCTGTASAINQSRKSFPSGHSSLSFTGMTFVVFMLLGRSGALSSNSSPSRHITSSRSRYINSYVLPFYSSDALRRLVYSLCVSPWCLSLYVATSRLVDHWHHPSDILAGSLIGLVCAGVGYHMWFPNVFSVSCGTPLDDDDYSNTDEAAAATPSETAPLV